LLRASAANSLRPSAPRGMEPLGIVNEDAATGAAARSLRAYLVKHGNRRAATLLHIAQEFEMARPTKFEVKFAKRKKLTPRVKRAPLRFLKDQSTPSGTGDNARLANSFHLVFQGFFW